MKISEAIAILEEIKAKHGDVVVMADDPSDYGCWEATEILEPGEKPYSNRGPIEGCLIV